MAGLAKILLSHRFGLLPANLHFKHPNQDIPGLLDGRLKVVTENTPFSGRYAALSSFGFGGTNVHILLKLTPKELPMFHKPRIPILLLASGRTSEAVEYHLNQIRYHGENLNLIALTHATFKTNISRHPYRGYGILSESEPEIQIHNCLNHARRPIWFIFTGLGSQWVGMSKDMMSFKTFHDSILKSSQILLENGFDLLKVLETEDTEILENLKNSIVSITSIQIALVDLLTTGYIWLVWKAFSKQQGVNFEELPVVLENLRFERSTVLNYNAPVSFIVSILLDNGEFEVLENSGAVCRGSIRMMEGNYDLEVFKLGSKQLQKDAYLDKQSFYKDLRLRGYEYSEVFQGVSSIGTNGDWAEVNWNENWVTFLDAILQTGIVRSTRRGLYLPIRLEKVTIDPARVKNVVTENSASIQIQYSNNLEVTQCPGVEFRGMKVSLAARRSLSSNAIFTEHLFKPYVEQPGRLTSVHEVIEFFVGIAIDNTFGREFTLTEMLTESCQTIFTIVTNLCPPKFSSPDLRLVPMSQEVIQSQIRSKIITLEELQELKFSNLIFTDTDKGLNVGMIQNCGFLIYKGEVPTTGNEDLVLVSQKQTQQGMYALFRKVPNTSLKQTFISMDAGAFAWLKDFKYALKSRTHQNERIILTSKVTSGILGLVKCLIAEHGYENVRCVYSIDDKDFNFEDASEQLKFDLVFNVRKNNEWGCYGNFAIPNETLTKPRPTTEAYADALVTGDLSSAFFTKNFIEKGVKNDETSWLMYFMMLHMTLADPGIFEKELNELSSFDDKLLFTAKKLAEVYVNFEIQEIMCMAISFAGRLKIGYSYEPTNKVRSRTVLIKTLRGGFDKSLGNDYGLPEYCSNKVEVIEVDGHHHCFHENPLELGIPSMILTLMR
ncbi:unnamed protein product [Allacma fusca]|uniref:Uncharacterized protein n=2 Tax=Allacma fusca TaxID=39272 RepID=A0A8J2LRE7_9HEXA|nr:unnamed protein product [Allacma fusca]